MLGNILSTGEQVLILVVLLAVGFLCGKIRISRRVGSLPPRMQT